MMIIRDCNKCGKDYMYDPNWQPYCKEICQDCYEKEMEVRK
jgi:hypothetical protein